MRLENAHINECYENHFSWNHVISKQKLPQYTDGYDALNFK